MEEDTWNYFPCVPYLIHSHTNVTHILTRREKRGRGREKEEKERKRERKKERKKERESLESLPQARRRPLLMQCGSVKKRRKKEAKRINDFDSVDSTNAENEIPL